MSTSRFRVLVRAAFVLCVTVASVAESAEPEPLPTVEEAVRRHEATWASFGSIRTDYELTSDYGDSPIPSGTVASRWVVEGDRERLTFDVNRTVVRDDWLVDGETVWRMTSPDHANRTDLRCTIARDTPSGPRYEAQPQFLRRIHYVTDLPPTVGEMAASWKLEASDGGVTPQGDRLLRLHAVPPYAEDDERAGSFVDLYLNRDKGWLVHRADAFLQNFGFDASRPDQPVDCAYRHETMTYRDLGDGRWFPEETVYLFFGKSEPADVAKDRTPKFSYRWKATTLSFDAPVDPDTFRLFFPEGAVVRDERGEETRILIWGADGEAAEVFTSPEAYDACDSLRSFVAEIVRGLAALRLAVALPTDATP